jgi:proteasome lid subunit RPN8/RPN11
VRFKRYRNSMVDILITFSNTYLQQRLESQEQNGYHINTELLTLKQSTGTTQSEFYQEKQRYENRIIELEKQKIDLDKQVVFFHSHPNSPRLKNLDIPKRN